MRHSRLTSGLRIARPAPRTPVLFALATGLLAGVVSCAQILGVGDPGLETDSTGSTGQTTTGTDTGTTSTGPLACALTDPSCLIGGSDCIALVDNAGKSKFALRVAQVNFFKPDALKNAAVKPLLASAVTLNMPACNLHGSGTFSWIAQLDKDAKTMMLGVSKPVANPMDGFTFVNETDMVNGMPVQIAPAKVSVTLGGDGSIHPDTVDQLVVPVYLDQDAKTVLYVPLHKLSIPDLALSQDQNCVGHYNAEGLTPDNGCYPDAVNGPFPFVTGATVNGYVDLEEADKIIVTALNLNRSLCVLLSPSPGQFSDGGSPQKCKRDAMGKILFPGDWCEATNAAGDISCHDAMQFTAAIAASAVKLN
jgi:hypothetical protein